VPNTTPTAVLNTVISASNTAVVAPDRTSATKRRRPRESSKKQEPLPRTASSRPGIMHERDNDVLRIPNLRGSTSSAQTNNIHDRLPVSNDEWRIQTPLPRHAQTRQQHSRNAYTSSATTTATRTNHSTHSNGGGDIYVAHSCLLIPVVVAVWWYWTKRAAKRVLRKLTMLPETEACGPSMNDDTSEHDNHYSNYGCTDQYDTFDSDYHATNTSTTATSSAATHANRNGQEYQEQQHQQQQRQQQHARPSFEEDNNNDKFNTWEDVLENETSDPSVRFVRWIKGKNHKAKRRMAAVSRFSLRRRSHPHLNNNSNNASAGSGLGLGGGGGEPEGDGLEKTTPILQGASSICDTTSLSSVESGVSVVTTTPATAKERSTWQCIQDTGVEICAIETKDSNCNSVVLSTNEILERASPTRSGGGEGGGAVYA
jgi:hypothetical protein